MTNSEGFTLLCEMILNEFKNQNDTLINFYEKNMNVYEKKYKLDELNILIIFKQLNEQICEYDFQHIDYEPFFDDRLKLLVKNVEKSIINSHLMDFECVGYMNASEGCNDFSMFINENTYGSDGGFLWKFYDFYPGLNPSIDLDNTGAIFIHMNSLETIKKSAILKEEIKINKLKELITKNCKEQLKNGKKCAGCLESSDQNGECQCLRSLHE